MKKFAVVLGVSGLVAQDVVAAPPLSLSGYLPETVEEACAQMNEAPNIAACKIVAATEGAPRRIIVSVTGQQYAAAYTLAATTIGTISCKHAPTVITIAVSVTGPTYRTFDMWCSPANRAIKLMRGWRTADVTEMQK